MATNDGDYIYNWWDEYGKDPFKSYLDNEQERRDLENKIQTVIRLAMNRPSKDPFVINQPLVDFATNLAEKYSSKQPGLVWYFYRIAGIPDPLHIEKQRLQKIKEENDEKHFQEAYQRLSKEEQAEYDHQVNEMTKNSHSGHWQYHDDDCLCWKYFDDSFCNRGGYSWSCCGSNTESSSCYKTSLVSLDKKELRKQIPLPGYNHERNVNVDDNNN